MKKKNLGWTIALCGDVDCFEVERIDGSKFAPESDDDAAILAEQAGVPIIPVEELPVGFSRSYFGWVDTPSNRKLIEMSACGKRISSKSKAFVSALAEVDALEKQLGIA